MTPRQIIHLAQDAFAGKPAKVRSPKWQAFCNHVIDKHPVCIVCGNKNRKKLVGHHRIPYHLRPDLELVESNVAVICEDGPGNLNCHLVIGHRGSFQDYNENLDADAVYVGKIVEPRNPQ